jgi:hypothetical protein
MFMALGCFLTLIANVEAGTTPEAKIGIMCVATAVFDMILALASFSEFPDFSANSHVIIREVIPQLALPLIVMGCVLYFGAVTMALVLIALFVAALIGFVIFASYGVTSLLLTQAENNRKFQDDLPAYLRHQNNRNK